MTEEHLTEDALVALALGDFGPDQHDELQHLATCRTCRAAYDELSRTVDSVMTAAPSVAPPAGFDARVVDRIAAEAAPRRRPRRTVLLVAAAAAVLGVALGAVGARTLVDHPTLSASDQGAVLRTESGAQVGTVEPSAVGGEHVVVLQVTDGRPGTHYTCRMVLADGSTRDAGDWEMPSSGRSTWIAYGSSDAVDRVELVTDDGDVWSSASLS
jgi:anti-sigma factor RsiW